MKHGWFLSSVSFQKFHILSVSWEEDDFLSLTTIVSGYSPFFCSPQTLNMRSNENESSLLTVPLKKSVPLRAGGGYVCKCVMTSEYGFVRMQVSVRAVSLSDGLGSLASCPRLASTAAEISAHTPGEAVFRLRALPCDQKDNLK